jgi:hypothetical protein
VIDSARSRHHPPDGLDDVVVADGEGDTLCRTRISPEVYGQDAWDGGLFNAGYQRVSAWRPSLARFKCEVEAWLATTGMAGYDTRCHG